MRITGIRLGAKRARDLAIGLPTLLIWQAFEAKRLVGASGAQAKIETAPIEAAE